MNAFSSVSFDTPLMGDETSLGLSSPTKTKAFHLS